MSISNFFEDTLGANLSNSRWSWGATNPNKNQLFLRVWDDQLDVVDGVERISLLKKDWEGTSAGFPERKRHIETLRNGAEGFGVLCTAKDAHSIGSRSIANFDQATLLRFGEIIEHENHVYAEVVSRIAVEELQRQQTSQSSLLPDLKAILAKRGDVTTKEAIANARVGQGMFRAQVLAMWDSRCCVSGSRILDAIRASHIKPWRDSSNEERLDPQNGLPLIATYDALFDAGLITFSGVGELLICERLENQEVELLGLSDKRLIRQPSEQTVEYLKYHRNSIFLD